MKGKMYCICALESKGITMQTYSLNSYGIIYSKRLEINV